MFYEFEEAKAKPIGLISSPHPGTWVPEEFEEYLNPNKRAWNQDVDLEAHQLIDGPSLVNLGVHRIWQKLHRICIDLNRPRNTAVFNWELNSMGERLVERRPNADFEESVLIKYYDPYFRKIEELSSKNFLIIDLHSMPSQATEYHLKKNPQQEKNRPDFCVSELNAEANGPDETEFVLEYLKSKDYDARLNDPYVGGYITEHFAKRNCRVLQIETKRGLYMDENKREILPQKLSKLREDLTNLLALYFQKFCA